MENVTRRSFVQGAAAATAVVAGAGIVASARADEAAPAEEAPAGAAAPTAAQTFVGGRMRPEPHAGHPMPMITGYVGPDAMPIAPVEPPASWDIEADIVVVGTGMGGLTASTVAAQAGYRTVIVEKNAEIGGASAHSAINVALVGGSREQILNGYAWPGETYSIHEIVNKLNNVYQQTINLELLRSCVIGNAVWLDWMQDTQKPGWINVESRFGYPEIMDGTVGTLLGNQPTPYRRLLRYEPRPARAVLPHRLHGGVAGRPHALGDGRVLPHGAGPGCRRLGLQLLGLLGRCRRRVLGHGRRQLLALLLERRAPGRQEPAAAARQGLRAPAVLLRLGRQL